MRRRSRCSGAGREHAVGLQTAGRRQVVDQHADVGLLARQDERALATHPTGRVDAGHDALRRGLLVAGRSVDLAGEKQPLHPLRLQAAAELGRLDEVVLHGVAGPQHHRPFEARQGVHQALLDDGRETHRIAVDVDLLDVEPLGLENEQMPLAVRKPHHLVLERGAIAGADTADLAVEEGGLADVGPDEVVHAPRRVQEVARDPRPVDAVGQERERHRGTVAPLLLEPREVDAAAIEARRRSRLQPAPGESASLEGFGERARGRLAGASRRAAIRADVNQAVQEGPGGYDHGCATDAVSAAPGRRFQLDAVHAAPFYEDAPRAPEPPADSGLAAELVQHPAPVATLVGLGAR